MKHKTFSLVTISNHSLVILPGISGLTTVEFGFHILLKPLISVPVLFPSTVNQTGRQSTGSHLQLFHMQLWDSSDLFLFVYSLFACVQQNAFPCTSYTHIHRSFNFVLLLYHRTMTCETESILCIRRGFVNLGWLDMQGSSYIEMLLCLNGNRFESSSNTAIFFSSHVQNSQILLHL